MRSPWTHEELDALRQELTERITQEEEQNPEIRPLPPMTESECLGLLLAFGKLLPISESFLLGQLLAQYRQSVEARMLGKHGRYYVMSEADIERMILAARVREEE